MSARGCQQALIGVVYGGTCLWGWGMVLTREKWGAWYTLTQSGSLRSEAHNKSLIPWRHSSSWYKMTLTRIISCPLLCLYGIMQVERIYHRCWRQQYDDLTHIDSFRASSLIFIQSGNSYFTLLKIDDLFPNHCWNLKSYNIFWKPVKFCIKKCPETWDLMKK